MAFGRAFNGSQLGLSALFVQHKPTRVEWFHYFHLRCFKPLRAVKLICHNKQQPNIVRVPLLHSYFASFSLGVRGVVGHLIRQGLGTFFGYQPLKVEVLFARFFRLHDGWRKGYLRIIHLRHAHLLFGKLYGNAVHIVIIVVSLIFVASYQGKRQDRCKNCFREFWFHCRFLIVYYFSPRMGVRIGVYTLW